MFAVLHRLNIVSMSGTPQLPRNETCFG